ncbi:MAG TPA: hypothetical protein VNA14_05545 [Mycobacteriales bacterium]|nr:hypothetical protein [Mycobacteriales bacterium]
MTYRLLAAIAIGCLLTPACSAGPDEHPPRVAESSPSSSASLLPSLAGPKAQTLFEVIRENGVRPGGPDDFLIRDLIVVGEAQRAYLAVHGKVVSLEELKKAAGYRVGGSKLELVSGLGSSSRFCLRSYQSDDSPRQWFYDTSRVLPRGKAC